MAQLKTSDLPDGASGILVTGEVRPRTGLNRFAKSVFRARASWARIRPRGLGCARV